VSTAAALAAHPLFAGVDRDLIDRVAARAEDRRYDAGETVFREGEPIPGFAVLVEGAMTTVPTLAGEAAGSGYPHLHTAPTYFGAITLLSGGMQSGSARSVEPSRVIFVDPESFFDLLRAEPALAREVFSRYAPVVQRLEALRAQQEKLVALGGLAAGLAHELDNPAAAVRRSAAELATALGVLVDGAAPREPVRALARTAPPASPDTDPLAFADREEAWLERVGHEAWETAAQLAATGADPAALPADTTAAEMRWLAAALGGRALAAEIEEGASRISALVAAVKDYTQLDRTPEQEVDVHAGLESTLTMLRHRIAQGDVRLVREYDRGAPRVTGRASELNQVWTNLIGNALDALAARDGARTLTIRTRADGDGVEVEVADDGPGVPEELRNRIFEPFFTTKDVGAGMGIGLDLSWRIVLAHGGALQLRDDRPGETVFAVRLPAAGGAKFS
jgi:signal transduction histidine kinase